MMRNPRSQSAQSNLGIPAIKIGPRRRRISARNGEIEIDVMVKAAQIYALMALDIYTRTGALK